MTLRARNQNTLLQRIELAQSSGRRAQTFSIGGIAHCHSACAFSIVCRHPLDSGCHSTAARLLKHGVMRHSHYSGQSNRDANRA